MFWMGGFPVDRRLTGDSICKERFEVPLWQNLIRTQPTQQSFDFSHSTAPRSHSQAEFLQLRALSTSIPTHGHLPWMEVAQFLNQDMYSESSVPSHRVLSVQSMAQLSFPELI